MLPQFNFKTLETGFNCPWPVVVPVQQPNGKIEEQGFTAIFRVLSKPEDEAALEATTEKTPWAWLDARFVGIEGMDLTPELRAMLMNEPNTRNAIINAHANFRNGIPAKN